MICPSTAWVNVPRRRNAAESRRWSSPRPAPPGHPSSFRWDSCLCWKVLPVENSNEIIDSFELISKVFRSFVSHISKHFLTGPSQASFIVYLFSGFSNKHYNIYNKICEKIPSSIWCWDSNPRPLWRESPPTSTWPGLPTEHKQEFSISFCPVLLRLLLLQRGNDFRWS